MSGRDNQQDIELTIKDIANFGNEDVWRTNDFEEHESVEIGHVEWILGATVKTSEKTDNVKHLGVYVKSKPNSRSNLWSCQASVRFTLVKMNSNDKNDGFSMTFDQKFSSKNNFLEVPKFKNWEEAICYDNHFVLDKDAIIKAQITVKSVDGIHEKILETFAQPRESLFDAQLVVEGKKVYVGKQYLAQYSKYFFDLFYGSGSSSTDEPLQEIVIQDVVHSEFVDLLNLIYPTHFVINKENVGHLLKLADRFEVPQVLQMCENWLFCANNVHLVQKLEFAETYKLSLLQDFCLGQLKTSDAVVDLAKHAEYSSLTSVTHSVLLERIVELSKKPT